MFLGLKEYKKELTHMFKDIEYKIQKGEQGTK